MFHPAPSPSQYDVEQVVKRAGKRILRFLQRRGVITLQTAPGDGEVTVVGDETMGEKDPLLARLLAAATAGAPPAGWANKRKPVRIVLDPDDRPVSKGTLCSQDHGFNLHAATRVAANDKPGRETLCRYILRPPLANERLHILADGNVKLEFKRPWSDGTTSIEISPLALIARLAALVPPPRRHTTRYFGVLSSHATSRSEVVPAPAKPVTPAEQDKPKKKSRYIRWSELLRRVFALRSCPRVHARSWRRLVGKEADPLLSGVTPLIPPADRAWGAAVRHLRGNGLLVENSQAKTWAPGPGLDAIQTDGWPDGRARFVLGVLQRRNESELMQALPEGLQRWVDAPAA